MHLRVDPKNHVATLFYIADVAGTLEFESYEVLNEDESVNKCILTIEDMCTTVDIYRCSNCKKSIQTRQPPKYCYECGYKVDRIVW